jgi:hypothetical protein
MMRKAVVCTLMVLCLGYGPGSGQALAGAKKAEPILKLVAKTAGVLTLWSLGHAPRTAPSHTFLITHGLGGIQDRFFDLGKRIGARDSRANVLVVDWSPGAIEKIGSFPNPWAAAKQIDPSGDALGKLLVKLEKKRLFSPQAATFIGESFGNYVNNRAAELILKAVGTKVQRALALNPASERGGYQPPLLRQTFQQSVAFVTASLFDTRHDIAHALVVLTTTTTNPFAQHTYGIQWLLERVQAGEDPDSCFGLANGGTGRGAAIRSTP